MMRANFQRSLSAVLRQEGGYVDHPKDPGGATNLGITIGTAKANRMDLDHDGDVDKADVRLIKPSDAAPVYKTRYWDAVRGDDLPSGLDLALFDFAVNSGPAKAAITLQTILGVASDGKIGPITLAAIAKQPVATLINELCSNRLAFLERLSTWATFGKGWASRVKAVRDEALSLAKSRPPEPIPSPDAQTKPKSSLAALVAVLIGLVAALVAFLKQNGILP